MADIAGIQLGSQIVANIAKPVDGKMELDTATRLTLSFVQRWLGMIVYDKDLNVWKMLETNPSGDITIETDWIDFGEGGGEGDVDCPIKYTTMQTNSAVPYYGKGIPMMLTPECETLLYSTKTLDERVEDNKEAIALLGGSEIVELTIVELKALQQATTLETSKRYLVTDYVTKYNMAEMGIVMTGISERILFTPTSENTFEQVVYSLDYPQDIIHLDIDNVLCEDGTTPRIGKITFRKETTLSLDTAYDFRNVKFRRWDYTTITGYTGTYLGGITNGWKSPVQNTQIINGVTFNVNGNSYRDYYTFTMLTDLSSPTGGGNMRNISIEGMDKLNIDAGRHYNNIVFLAPNDFEAGKTLSNHFGNGCYAMTFSRLQDVTFEAQCKNIVASSIISTEIGSQSMNLYGHMIDNCGKIGSQFTNCTFEVLLWSRIGSTVGNFIMKQIRKTTIESGISGGGINLESATHIQDGTYNKTVFKRMGGATKISYYDESDNLNIVNIDT